MKKRREERETPRNENGILEEICQRAGGYYISDLRLCKPSAAEIRAAVAAIPVEYYPWEAWRNALSYLTEQETDDSDAVSLRQRLLQVLDGKINPYSNQRD